MAKAPDLHEIISWQYGIILVANKYVLPRREIHWKFRNTARRVKAKLFLFCSIWRTNISLYFLVHVPSKSRAASSGKVMQRLTTPENLNLEEKDNHAKTHSEESRHDLQTVLSSEKDSPASAKPFEKTDDVHKSSECPAESHASKLQVDNAKQVAVNDVFDKP